MRSKLLFPSYFRVIGIVLIIPGLIFGCLTFVFSASESYCDELAISLLSVSLLFIGCSRLRDEDENRHKIRQNALYWAVLVDGFCIATLWLLLIVDGLIYIPVLDKIVQLSVDFYNWLFILVIFIGRFYYLLYKFRTKGTIPSLPLITFKPFNIVGKILVAVIVLLVTIAGVFSLKNDFYMNLFLLAPSAFLLLIVSKERYENNEVTNIRLNSMLLAVYVNYTLFISATWLIYGFDYLDVLIYSLIAIPVIFALIFYIAYFLSIKRARHVTVSSS